MTRSLLGRTSIPAVVLALACVASGAGIAAASPDIPASVANIASVQERAESGLLSRAEIRLAARRFGRSVGFAVVDLAGGPVRGVAGVGPAYALSTLKVLIVAQLLQDRGGPQRLTRVQRRNVRRALSQSVNEAAAALNTDLKHRHGGAAATAAVLTRLLRRAGDHETRVRPGATPQSNYGMTLWSAANQVRFMAALARGCLLDPQSTRFLIREMGHVVSDQAWGLGRAGSPAYKGGWGTDGDGRYLVRQFGLLRARDGNEYAVAFTARSHDGRFESGQVLNTRVARWIRAHVTQAPAPSGCSGT